MLTRRLALASSVLSALSLGPALHAEDSKPADSPLTVTFVPALQGGVPNRVFFGDAVLNGDINADGRRDITDVYLLARHLFSGGPPPATVHCVPSAAQDSQETKKQDVDLSGTDLSQIDVSRPTVRNGDVDASGALNLTDLFRLARYLFAGDPQEPAAIGCDPAGLAL